MPGSHALLAPEPPPRTSSGTRCLIQGKQLGHLLHQLLLCGVAGGDDLVLQEVLQEVMQEVLQEVMQEVLQKVLQEVLQEVMQEVLQEVM